MIKTTQYYENRIKHLELELLRVLEELNECHDDNNMLYDWAEYYREEAGMDGNDYGERVDSTPTETNGVESTK